MRTSDSNQIPTTVANSQDAVLSGVEESYRLITLVGGCMDTRTNKEDFALTPYLSGVWVKSAKTAGIGITWGWWSAYIGIAFMLSKKVKRFRLFK